MSDHDALVGYLAVEIEGALNRYPLINLERGEYDAIADAAALACVDAGFVPTANAERVAELQRERDALAATLQRVHTAIDDTTAEGHRPGGFSKHATTERGWLTSTCECGEFAWPCPHYLRAVLIAVQDALSSEEVPHET